jgi:hypothetical protein
MTALKRGTRRTHRQEGLQRASPSLEQPARRLDNGERGHFRDRHEWLCEVGVDYGFVAGLLELDCKQSAGSCRYRCHDTRNILDQRGHWGREARREPGLATERQYAGRPHRFALCVSVGHDGTFTGSIAIKARGITTSRCLRYRWEIRRRRRPFWSQTELHASKPSQAGRTVFTGFRAAAFRYSGQANALALALAAWDPREPPSVYGA